jgi:hypothetical protein
MYQHVMRAYQTQSPQYGPMLNHYTARCLSGSSSQPTWGHDYRLQRHDTYDNDRREGYDNNYWRRGW